MTTTAATRFFDTDVTHTDAHAFRAIAGHELRALLTSKYGVPQEAMDGLDRTALLRAAATLDFISNNLPPASPIHWSATEDAQCK